MKKLNKVIDLLREHEGKIEFILWTLVVLTACGIMALTVVNDHIIPMLSK
jgi:hypothetical protein